MTEKETVIAKKSYFTLIGAAALIVLSVALIAINVGRRRSWDFYAYIAAALFGAALVIYHFLRPTNLITYVNGKIYINYFRWKKTELDPSEITDVFQRVQRYHYYNGLLKIYTNSKCYVVRYVKDIDGAVSRLRRIIAEHNATVADSLESGNAGNADNLKI